ncbi:MAG: ATP-binding protein [Candidatus Nezhaarchaeota archaeon]|nr:ATP-binding protein [Candidatus Nezhaarchaeota archaeon]
MLANDISEALKRSNVDLKLDVDADLIQASSGLTLHDVETAALESFYTTKRFTVEKFTEYKIKILREMGLQYVQPSRGFESVGGYEYLKKYIVNRVIKPLRDPESARRYGLSVPKGILLYGPPGTGKTWFGKALAKEVGLPMVILSPADLLRGIVGETEARVRQITTIVESLAPVVVFIDEFDQLTMGREHVMSTDSGVTRRMTNMLLEWLGREDRRAFIVGATNFVEHIDPAFLRPGSLDEVIPVLPPDVAAREEILRVHMNIVRKVPTEDSVNLRMLAERTYAWTGAELEKLVLEAASLAMEQSAQAVTQEHFAEAMSTIEVNIQEREQKLKMMVQKLKRLENVNQSFLKHALAFYTRAEGEDRVRGILEAAK